MFVLFLVPKKVEICPSLLLKENSQKCLVAPCVHKICTVKDLQWFHMQYLCYIHQVILIFQWFIFIATNLWILLMVYPFMVLGFAYKELESNGGPVCHRKVPGV